MRYITIPSHGVKWLQLDSSNTEGNTGNTEK